MPSLPVSFLFFFALPVFVGQANNLESVEERVECAPRLDVKDLVYNRIPKAGSGTMLKIFEDFSDELCYFVGSSSSVHVRAGNIDHEKRVCEGMIDKSEGELHLLDHCHGTFRRNVRVAHYFYVDCTLYPHRRRSPSDPGYINVIRNPISRCNSRFSYDREMNKKSRYNGSLDECMSQGLAHCSFEQWAAARLTVANGKNHPEHIKGLYPSARDGEELNATKLLFHLDELDTASEGPFRQAPWSRELNTLDECSTNYQTRFFCGTHPDCLQPGPLMLQRAKENIRKHYIFVGLMEEMEITQRILHHLLPQYIGVVKDLPCQKCRTGGHKAHVDIPEHGILSESNQAILERLNAQDLELYQFVKERFYRVDACVNASITMPSAVPK